MQAARGTPLTGPGAPADGGQPGRPAEPGEPGAAVTPRRVGILVGTALTVLALDLISKHLVVANLSDHSVRLLGGFLTLLVSRNPGAAFSIGTSMTLVFSVIAVSVIVIILRTSRRIRSIPWALTLGLLLGGATGNLIDRIFRYPGLFRGYVVDWIEVPHWPVFNLADSAIVCGGILAVLLSARGTRLDGLRIASGPPAAGEARPPSAGTAPADQGTPAENLTPERQNEDPTPTPADHADAESAHDGQRADGQSSSGQSSVQPGDPAGGAA
jgi:signal peptidase II